MPIHPLIAATHRCAEIKEHWSAQPGNQRPLSRDPAANLEWWQRWHRSQEHAHCEMLLRAGMETIEIVSQTATTPQP